MSQVRLRGPPLTKPYYEPENHDSRDNRRRRSGNAASTGDVWRAAWRIATNSASGLSVHSSRLTGYQCFKYHCPDVADEIIEFIDDAPEPGGGWPVS